ncbi:MAG: hypothetical protein NVSMB59_04940 [Vulcanimicrobiaceae bacterium]
MTGGVHEREVARLARNLARCEHVRNRSTKLGIGVLRRTVEASVGENGDDERARAQAARSSRRNNKLHDVPFRWWNEN